MKLYAVIVVTWIHWCIHPFLTIVIAEDDLVDFLGLVAFLNLFKVLGASPITSKPQFGPVPHTKTFEGYPQPTYSNHLSASPS